MQVTVIDGTGRRFNVRGLEGQSLIDVLKTDEGPLDVSERACPQPTTPAQVAIRLHRTPPPERDCLCCPVLGHPPGTPQLQLPCQRLKRALGFSEEMTLGAANRPRRQLHQPAPQCFCC